MALLLVATCIATSNKGNLNTLRHMFARAGGRRRRTLHEGARLSGPDTKSFQRFQKTSYGSSRTSSEGMIGPLLTPSPNTFLRSYGWSAKDHIFRRWAVKKAFFTTVVDLASMYKSSSPFGRIWV